MAESPENLEPRPAQPVKRNVLSWKCEKGFFVGLICSIVIATLLFAVLRFQLVAIAPLLLIWIAVPLLNSIILFAGMKIGGIFAVTAGALLYQIFFYLFVVLAMVVPGAVPEIEISISFMLLRLLNDVIFDPQAWMWPLRVFLMAAALHFAGRFGWFGGKNTPKHVCTVLVLFAITNFIFDILTISNFAIVTIIGSIGGIIGYWVGKRILERIGANADCTPDNPSV